MNEPACRRKPGWSDMELAGQSSGLPETGPFISPLSQHILIENRENKFTSRKAAVSFIARGIAQWTNEAHTAIRFLEPQEQFAARAARQEQRYWRDVAAQRGGQDVAFQWKPTLSNGYVVMGATPVAIQKRPQLAQVAPQGCQS